MVSGSEAALPVAQERNHGLVMLGEEGDEVRMAVAIEVGHRDVDGPAARVDLALHEDRGAIVGGAVLEQEHPSRRAPAEGGDDEVEVAVAVEVGGLDVRDARAARRPG